MMTTQPDHEKRIRGERLDAISKMVSGLAHENRNALQRAQSCLDLLELDLSERDELLRLTDRIRGALSDLNNNYEDVRHYAAPIALQRCEVNLSQLCQTAFDELVESTRPRVPPIRIACELACERVAVDPHRMKEVFRNLLENALQADSPEPDIVVRFCCRDSASCRRVEIAIRDHGEGLSDEAQRRMFEPFFTTRQHGTGLGLALCQRIVEAHDGNIIAANHPDGGAQIKITLPRVCRNADSNHEV